MERTCLSPGTRVVYANPKGGPTSHQKRVNKTLKFGEIYTVSTSEEHHNRVVFFRLVEIERALFHSGFFEIAHKVEKKRNQAGKPRQ